MNERIYELALQAEIAAHNGNHVDVKIMMAKFGALIVRECAELNFRELGLSGSSSFDVSRMIKQHFGVEN